MKYTVQCTLNGEMLTGNVRTKDEAMKKARSLHRRSQTTGDVTDIKVFETNDAGATKPIKISWPASGAKSLKNLKALVEGQVASD